MSEEKLRKSSHGSSSSGISLSPKNIQEYSVDEVYFSKEETIKLRKDHLGFVLINFFY